MSQLTLAELERHLWGAADLLRASIDSGDFKHYIFGLLFYKRLCDVWEEEYEQRLAEYEDAALPAGPGGAASTFPRAASGRPSVRRCPSGRSRRNCLNSGKGRIVRCEDWGG